MTEARILFSLKMLSFAETGASVMLNNALGRTDPVHCEWTVGDVRCFDVNHELVGRNSPPQLGRMIQPALDLQQKQIASIHEEQHVNKQMTCWILQIFNGLPSSIRVLRVRSVLGRV